MNINILIADDEPNQLELMSFNLENAGFTILKLIMERKLLNW